MQHIWVAAGGEAAFEVRNLQRTLKNSTVPVPKTLLRMILNATLPRLLQRTLLVALPRSWASTCSPASRASTLQVLISAEFGAMTKQLHDTIVHCTSLMHILKITGQTLRVCLQHQLMAICPPCHVVQGNLQDGHGFCQWHSPFAWCLQGRQASWDLR